MLAAVFNKIMEALVLGLESHAIPSFQWHRPRRAVIEISDEDGKRIQYKIH